MNIYIKLPKEVIEIKGRHLDRIFKDVEDIDLPPAALNQLRATKARITDRLNPLKQEIEAEEYQRECYIFLDYGVPELTYNNYTRGLLEKMGEYLTYEDINSLNDKFRNDSSYQ